MLLTQIMFIKSYKSKPASHNNVLESWLTLYKSLSVLIFIMWTYLNLSYDSMIIRWQ